MRYWLQKEVAMADLPRIPRRQLSLLQEPGAGWTGAAVVDEVPMDEEVWKVEGVVVAADMVEISTMVVRMSRVEITVDPGPVTVVRISKVEVSTTVVRISRVEIIVVSIVEAGRVISDVTVEAGRVMSDVTVDAGAVTVVRISKVEVSTTVVRISRVEVLMIVVRISRVEIIVVSIVDAGAVIVMVDADTEAVTVMVDADADEVT
jgi:hypothetical protein